MMITPSNIELLGTKLVFSFNMMLGSIIFNLLAMAFARILHNMLHKEIGLYSSKDSGFSFLGMSAMKVLFNYVST